MANKAADTNENIEAKQRVTALQKAMVAAIDLVYETILDDDDENEDTTEDDDEDHESLSFMFPTLLG